MAADGEATLDPRSLLSDQFEVDSVNPDGKKFAKVDRIAIKSEMYGIEGKLDVHSDLFPVRAGEKITFTVASTLRPDGEPDGDEFDQSGAPSLLDDYDYGMCGRVFKYEQHKRTRMRITASFGGLLMLLEGEQRFLRHIRNNAKIYVLMRRPE